MPLLVLALLRTRRGCSRGFTLIEIMVVVVIMGVLAALMPIIEINQLVR